LSLLQKARAPNSDVSGFTCQKAWESEFAIVRTTAHSFGWRLRQRWSTKKWRLSVKSVGIRVCYRENDCSLFRLTLRTKVKAPSGGNFLSKSILIRADYRKNDHLLFLVTFWDKYKGAKKCCFFDLIYQKCNSLNSLS